MHSDQSPPPDHLNPAFLDPDFDARFNKAFPKATIRKIWKALKDAVDISSDGRKPAETCTPKADGAKSVLQQEEYILNEGLRKEDDQDDEAAGSASDSD